MSAPAVPPRRSAPPGPRALLPADAATTVAAIALGALATTLVVLLLAALGGAAVEGPTTGLIAVPVLAALALRAPGALVAATTTAPGLLALGAAWTVLPLVDHHLLGAVAISGAPADLAFHVAGWSALLASARLGRHQEPAR